MSGSIEVQTSVPDDDESISKKESARLLSVCTKTIDRLIDTVPEFPKPIVLPYVERKHVRFSKREIIAFRDRLRQKPAKRLKPAQRLKPTDPGSPANVQKPTMPDMPTDGQGKSPSRIA